ncbi:MAG: terpene cyclase/mutase family protein [Planctomycetes bacterium]|nr:terpene cyclase/mutase family protein [Planctomycetota bacterium]
MRRTLARAVLAWVSALLTVQAAAQEPPQAPAAARSPERRVPPLAIQSALPDAEAVATALARAIDFLRGAQKESGAFGGSGNMFHHETWANAEAHRSWTVATSGLCLIALLRHGGASPATRTQAERAVDFIVANHDLRRCDDWDTDHVWGLLYATHALAEAALHPWFATGERRAALDAALSKLLARIAAYQSPDGGFAYYAEKEHAWRPEWSTSFTTAAMVVAIDAARAAGHRFDDHAFAGALRAVARCRLPSGAFTYDVMALPEPGDLEGIDDPRGSLCRIPVCELALARGGRPASEAVVARGIDLFFRHHAYLDVARMRPLPHEAYHANSGYFYFFGHAYLGELLPALPPALRRDTAAKLAFEVIKTQEPDGACWDYYFSDYAKPYGTAFAAIALGRAHAALAEPVGK